MGPIELIKLLSQWDKVTDGYKALQKEGKMLSFWQVIKSRTVWTVVFTGLFNAWNSYNTGTIDPNIVKIINGFFGIGIIYFRINPKQK